MSFLHKLLHGRQFSLETTVPLQPSMCQLHRLKDLGITPREPSTVE
jgi:hypothetical protein